MSACQHVHLVNRLSCKFSQQKIPTWEISHALWVGGIVYTLSPANHNDTWSSVSTRIRNRTDSAFLRVCYAAASEDAPDQATFTLLSHVLVIIPIISPDRKWLENDFPGSVSSRRSAISLKTNRPAAISATRGIITALSAWINDTSPQEIFSLGVVSTGTSIRSGQNDVAAPSFVNFPLTSRQWGFLFLT